MSIRVNCQACKTAFVTSDDQVGRSVTCPKCGAKQVAPSAALIVTPEPAEESVFVPSTEARRPRRRWAVLLALLFLAVGSVGVIVAWPSIRALLRPIPPDPIEVAATDYLQALAENDSAKSHQLGTVDMPPAIRSFRDVRHNPVRDYRLQGTFAPIAALHARIDEKFAFDPSIGRFTPRNALGPAAETLDALHEAKAKAEQDQIYKKMQSGDPEDLFDAAEGLGKVFTNLAEGALAPKKILPTYKQLVEDSKPPLSPPEEELALNYASHRETWDEMLKRPFPTLKADGPFLLERAEVTASAAERLGSSGDPPTTLQLTLTRFRLEGIDTGWKVTSARRATVNAAPSPDSGPAPRPQKPSPGESTP